MKYKLGFITNILYQNGVTNIGDVVDIAIDLGFDCLDVGPTYSVEQLGLIVKRGIGICALTYCRNLLIDDKEQADGYRRDIEERIRIAGSLGIPIVTVSAGYYNPIEKAEIYDEYEAIRPLPERSADPFFKAYTPLVKLAEKEKVRIAVENCPQMGNWAISPYLWKIMFKVIDSNSFGLAYDPSHMVWQFMDPYSPILDFKDRLFHIHAKDTEILPQVLKEKGTLTDFTWWRHRLPGWGSIDWRKILSLLMEVQYAGSISIEHEDELFSGSIAVVCEGLRKAKYHLKWCAGLD